MSEIQIPPEARKAAHKAFFEAWSNAITSHNRFDAAILAALEAWPGMTIGCNEVISPHGEYGPRVGIDHHIRLPIMEPRDET